MFLTQPTCFLCEVNLETIDPTHCVKITDFLLCKRQYLAQGLSGPSAGLTGSRQAPDH